MKDFSSQAQLYSVAGTPEKLSWNAVPTVPGAGNNPAGYKVHTGPQSGVYTQSFEAGTATTLTLTSLAPGTYYAVVRAYNAMGESPNSNEIVFMIASPVSTSYSVFTTSDTPSNTDPNDSQSVELGMTFTCSGPGNITALRFWKLPTGTGTHVGHLWGPSGTLLASTTFSNETASGWQQALLGTPVPIDAGSTYTASYHCAGHYACNKSYFTSALARGPLTVPGPGKNGVYAYGTASKFPTSTYSNCNYWVDVVYVPTTPVLYTYAAWMTKLNAEVGSHPTPAALVSWLTSNPPTHD